MRSAGRARRALAAVGWPALALGGLLLGAVALASDPAREAADGPARRFLLLLPDSLVTAALVVGSVAVLLLFAFLMALARLKGQDKDLPRTRWGMLALPILLAAAAVGRFGSAGDLFSFSPLARFAERESPFSGRDLAAVSSPLFTVAVGALIVAGALALLGFAVFVLFGDRISEWWGRSFGAPRSPLAVAVDESLDDLRTDADPRAAILRCYRRFEHLLARSSVPRAPWQTPLEFMREALARLPLPAEAVGRLTGVFERARFSNEALGPSDRDGALASLVDIRTALEAEAREAEARRRAALAERVAGREDALDG